jgi:glycogen debranching enzyme
MDLITHETIAVGTSADFVPLFAGCGRAHAAALTATLTRWGERVNRVVPSGDPFYAYFDPKRYRRGPVWAVVNSMIADGMASCGYADTAAHILADTKALIESVG